MLLLSLRSTTSLVLNTIKCKKRLWDFFSPVISVPVVLSVQKLKVKNVKMYYFSFSFNPEPFLKRSSLSFPKKGKVRLNPNMSRLWYFSGGKWPVLPPPEIAILIPRSVAVVTYLKRKLLGDRYPAVHESLMLDARSYLRTIVTRLNDGALGFPANSATSFLGVFWQVFGARGVMGVCFMFYHVISRTALSTPFQKHSRSRQ